MVKQNIKGYQVVADEYYDARRHPTCANFREASKLLLIRWVNELSPEGRFAEVGPGMSLMAEILAMLNRRISKLILVDSSPTMLGYSQAWSGAGAKLLLGDAEFLPIASKSLHGIISFLGDPYNSHSFWSEAGRVIKPGGIVLFTTPSYEWARKFRSSNNQKGQHSATFILRDGRVVDVLSLIYDNNDQVRMMSENGFRLERREEIAINDIKTGSISPKLCSERGLDAPIVTGYFAKRIG